MIKKWFKQIFTPKHGAGSACRIPVAEHGIHAKALGFAALKVTERLHHEGFEAYVVGGAVRDLLLGLKPKDVDVATNATPEQIRALFRRSRIIGRRFRIVHVMVGPETIEVTTFRGSAPAHQNEHGRIMQDNNFGSMAEDAMRRDFTCNALYYNPISQEIVDFHNGVADIRAKQLVMIGDPVARFQEDPVRILRAARLSAKLGFGIEEGTLNAVAPCANLIGKEPPARLFDELLKLLFSGESLRCFARIREMGIAQSVHPMLAAACAGELDPLVAAALANTDARVKSDKSVSAGFLLACLMWPTVRRAWVAHRAQGTLKDHPALTAAINDVRDNAEHGWGIPQRYSAVMREIWQFQPAFEARRGGKPFRLLTQPRFRAAYDFLLLRAKVGEAPQELAEWWTRFQAASEEEREAMAKAGKSRRSAQNTDAGRSAADAVNEHDDDDEWGDDFPLSAEAPKAPKKRRRRRKPRSNAQPVSSV